MNPITIVVFDFTPFALGKKDKKDQWEFSVRLPEDAKYFEELSDSETQLKRYKTWSGFKVFRILSQARKVSHLSNFNCLGFLSLNISFIGLITRSLSFINFFLFFRFLQTLTLRYLLQIIFHCENFWLLCRYPKLSNLWWERRDYEWK